MGSNVRIRYSRNDKGLKNTLVTIRDGNKVYFGIAMCNTKKDHFSKKLGVQIAAGRAELARELGIVNEFDFLRGRGIINIEDIQQLLMHFDDADKLILHTR